MENSWNITYLDHRNYTFHLHSLSDMSKEKSVTNDNKSCCPRNNNGLGISKIAEAVSIIALFKAIFSFVMYLYDLISK